MPSAPVAHYFDGQTAGRREAGVALDLARLHIVSHPDGAVLADWPYDSIEIVRPPRSGGPGLFTNRRDPDARLSIADTNLATTVAERVAAHEPRGRRDARMATAAWVAAGTAALIAAAYFFYGPLVDMAAGAIPERWERDLGRTTLSHLAPAAARCRDAAGEAALDRLVSRLATGVGGETRFEAQVSRNKVVNAFALPGGYMVLLSGLIDEAASGDEVAGVLAHEMAHVAERHSVRLILRHYGLSMLASVVMGSTRMSETLSGFGLLAYTRDFEAEADARAVDILKRSGIRGGGLASFFARLEKREGNEPGVLRYLRSHPPATERRDLVQRTADTGAPAMSDTDWQALRAICHREDRPAS